MPESKSNMKSFQLKDLNPKSLGKGFIFKSFEFLSSLQTIAHQPISM